MPKYSTLKRFRANPVEYGIFATVILLFAHSLYSLLYDSENFRFSAIKPMVSNPVTEMRVPANAVPTFLNVDLVCDIAGEKQTPASKLRLSGPICGLPNKEALAKTTIINDTNRFTATVFTDLDTAKFSTDYIPLNSGRNTIKVEFTYKGGKTYTQALVVNRGL